MKGNYKYDDYVLDVMHLIRPPDKKLFRLMKTVKGRKRLLDSLAEFLKNEAPQANMTIYEDGRKHALLVLDAAEKDGHDVQELRTLLDGLTAKELLTCTAARCGTQLCSSGDGKPCDHDGLGREWDTGFSTTCSRCGIASMDRDMWED